MRKPKNFHEHLQVYFTIWHCYAFPFNLLPVNMQQIPYIFSASPPNFYCDFYPSFFLDNLKILKKTNIQKIVSIDNSFFLTNF